LKHQKRKCTDVICCFIFSAFIFILMGFSFWGMIHGEINMMMAPVDGQGRICGFNETVKDYPNLWIADLNKALDSPSNMFKYSVCVKECPSAHN